MATSETYTDYDLVERLQEGQNEAMKAIYHDHFGMILYLVTKNGGNEADAEYIFQETLFILYDMVKRKGFDLNVELKIVVYSIAQSLWLNELGRRGRSTLRIKSYERSVMVDMSAHTNLVFAREKAYKNVAKAFRILGEKCQKVLTMHYFHHKSMSEIASLMEFSDADAKNQKYRCIQNLKRML